MSDDYWQRQDRQRDDWRADYARYDRNLAARDRAEADERGWRAMTGGDTFNAIREVAGPDAALHYAESMSEEDSDEWPPHLVVIDLDEFLANLYELTYPVTTRVAEVDDSQVKVQAVNGETVLGAFWAPVHVAAEYIEHTRSLVLSERSERFVSELRRALLS